jgi:hypothetical protein
MWIPSDRVDQNYISLRFNCPLMHVFIGGFSDNMTKLSFTLDIRRTSFWVVWFSVTVLALGYFREAFVMQFGTGTILKDLRHIALDTENCLGSYYSSVLMLVAAALMAMIGQVAVSQRWRVHWHVLAVVFVAMSLDETVSFHELLIQPLRPAFAFSSYLHFAWIVPGALFVLSMGLSYIPFVFALPQRVRNRIIAAGTIYVTGALGFEAISGHFIAVGGFSDPKYIAAFLIEETLEVLGLTLFALALLADLPRHFKAANPEEDSAPVNAGKAATTGAERQAELIPSGWERL